MKPGAAAPVDIARRGALRRGVALAPTALLLAGCLRRDPAIGVELVYESTTPAAVTDLWFDVIRILGGRLTALHIGPDGWKREARQLPPAPDPVPAVVRARWRYEAIDPVDEAALQGLPDDRLPWREAQDSAALREAMSPDALTLLRREPDRHRLRLAMVFDRERLLLRWQVRRWR
ncbi:hypothetical protein [Zeimonas arvi]|uniref:Uncharacterized protein n=1 Tax=Zeimonas arvi TaxID=2498847 RepID=A0A5C8NTZ7_9BURK|nr:hypothetical protein [Zeimonas arvi]TXL64634.1 hypothetical protein FHP08_12855 [Zeimonas arvi]